MGRRAAIPDRCIACNAPASRRLKRQLRWHKPWIYVFILFNILLYALVALASSQQAQIEIPLCEPHLRRRRVGIAVAWSLALLGIASLLAPLLVDSPWPAALSLFTICGLLLFLPGALIATLIVSQPVVAHRIDEHHVWLGRCSKKFLDTLPVAPAGF